MTIVPTTGRHRGVDEVGVQARAAKFWARSIKSSSQLAALELAISMTDLTTLEGDDSPGKVRSLCLKSVYPDPEDASCPAVAAVCVYPDRVPLAREALAALGAGGRKPAVASVAGAFPSGRSSSVVRLADVRDAVQAGADEIDMVIDRGAFLAGHYGQIVDDVASVVEAAGKAHVKAILETGELGNLQAVRTAAWAAMEGGAHFIKTSTGKISPAATPEAVLVMLEAAREYAHVAGRQVGVKAAGGIRSAKDAVRYLIMVGETVGEGWLDPAWFRFGASTLLNDLVMQRTHCRTGVYPGPDYVSIT